MTLGQNTVSAEQLRGYVERYEVLEKQKIEIKDDQAIIMAEATAKGFIPKAIRYLVKVRKLKPSQHQEDESLRETYLHSMGMLQDTPLFRHVGMMAVDTASRDNVIEAMKKFVPLGGSITIDAGGGKPVRLTRDKDGTVMVAEVAEEKETEEHWTRPATPDAPVPDATPDEAQAMGAQAHKDDIPIIKNPFPFGDVRRQRWDKGWRSSSGDDGMGPND